MIIKVPVLMKRLLIARRLKGDFIVGAQNLQKHRS